MCKVFGLIISPETFVSKMKSEVVLLGPPKRQMAKSQLLNGLSSLLPDFLPTFGNISIPSNENVPNMNQINNMSPQFIGNGNVLNQGSPLGN
jgi:hypothetical protein